MNILSNKNSTLVHDLFQGRPVDQYGTQFLSGGYASDGGRGLVLGHTQPLIFLDKRAIHGYTDCAVVPFGKFTGLRVAQKAERPSGRLRSRITSRPQRQGFLRRNDYGR